MALELSHACPSYVPNVNAAKPQTCITLFSQGQREHAMPDTPSKLLRSRRPLRQVKPRAPDPADMGTAFGMDYMLDQQRPDQASSAVGPVASRPAWLPRWLKGALRG